MKKVNETPKEPLCGFCAGATESAHDVRKQHARCPGNCACAANNHKVNTELAQRMANYCHTTVEHVYARHGQRQRIISDERRAQLAEQLVRARAAKEAKAS